MFDRIREVYRRLHYYLHRNRFHRELDEELRAHLEMKIQEIAQQGISSEQARRTATLQLGNRTLIRETSREVFSFGRLEALVQDLKYGFRALFKKNRALSFTAILILGLGIGATTTIFSLVNAIMLNPLGYSEPDKIVTVWRYQGSPFSGPDLADLTDQSRAFSDLSGFEPTGFNVAGVGLPERL